MSKKIKLCSVDTCRLIDSHGGKHNPFPTIAWGFMEKIDKNKLTKAGFATPRGGSKGAYQNHVLRSNKTIIPYEKLDSVNLKKQSDGYVIRIFPEQYFTSKNKIKEEFLRNRDIIIGNNAFIIYRTHEAYEAFPPLKGWEVRSLSKNGKSVDRRGKEVLDHGHFVFRIPTLGEKKANSKGPPQGIFAPEYADEETNYLCKCVLAWLIIHTYGSPYTTEQADHLKLILQKKNLLDDDRFEIFGILRHGICCCPLCLRIINYEELHSLIDFSDETALENAGFQIRGATRSTIVNLFHLEPLIYESIKHIPTNIAWGHGLCNTRLGQRQCFSLAELKQTNLKVGIIHERGVRTFGWISEDLTYIRGPNGSVWIQISQELKPN